jgi:hypothetical protein
VEASTGARSCGSARGRRQAASGGPAQEGKRQSADARAEAQRAVALAARLGAACSDVAVQLRRERLGQVQAAERTAGAALLL